MLYFYAQILNPFGNIHNFPIFYNYPNLVMCLILAYERQLARVYRGKKFELPLLSVWEIWNLRN